MKKFTIKNLFFLLGLVLFASAASAQSTIFVNGAAAAGGDGAAWGTAYQYLDDALAGAQDGDQIWVAAGTYIPGGASPSRDTSFFLKNGVDLFGGFAGTEAMMSERDFNANVTVLNGDIDGDDGMNDFLSPARFANTRNVIVADTNVMDAIVDGFTISHAHTDTLTAGVENQIRGGGMFITGSLTVRNCILEQNYANFGGGAYPRFAGASGTSFTDCTFRNNRARNGGGMFMAGADDFMVVNCTFTGNIADASGGGLFTNGGLDMTLQSCVFDGNQAAGGGGGAILPVANLGLTIDDCDFRNNTAATRGGAIDIENCDFTMTASVVDSNDCGGFGGGIIALSCNFLMDDVTISNNITGTGAGEGGGGIYTGVFTDETSNHTIRNSTIVNNTAPFGGGVAAYSDGSLGTYDNVNFAGNAGETAGGGMSISFGGDVIMVNCDMSNNNNAQAGGALFTSRENSSIQCANTTFENNNASNFGGGALYMTASAVHVFDSCFFNGNVSTVGFGGAINYLPDSFVTNILILDQCHFQNNNGFDQGGALNISDGDVQVTNCLFNFNKTTSDPMSGVIAGRGGFIANNCGLGDTSRVLLVNNTIANSTGDFAGGISQWEADSTTASAQVVMVNNIFHNPYTEDYAIEQGFPEVISLGGNKELGNGLATFLTASNDEVNVTDFGFIDDYAETDFGLLNTSPLCGQGVSIPGLTLPVDHAGEPRAAAPTPGAYECEMATSTRPEIGDANSLQLTPNPAVDFTQVKLTNEFIGEVRVRLSNVLGQTISITQQDKNVAEYQFELNTTNLVPGLYEVSIEFDNQVVTRKLMKN